MLNVFIRMAWRNIFYSPRKSALAVLAVGACYFSLNLFQGYIQGTEVIFNDSYEKRSMFGDLLVKRSGTRHMFSAEEEDLLSKEEQEKLAEYFRQSEQVAVAVRFLRVNGTLSNGASEAVFTGLAIDAPLALEMRKPEWEWNAIAGTILREDSAAEILLGQRLGLLLGCEPTSKEQFITGRGGYEPKVRPFACANPKLQVAASTLRGQANAIELEVVGLVDAMFSDLDLRFQYMPLSAAQRLLDTDRISFFSLRLKPGVDLEGFLTELNDHLQTANLPIKALSWKDDEMGEFYRRTMDFLHLFRNFMVVVILGVALLSIFNTFFRNVQERTREIGVLRTLGFRLKEIRTLFLLETLFLALIGVFTGGGLAVFAAGALNRMEILYKVGLLTQPVPFLVDLSFFTLSWTFLVVLIVALAAALLPLILSGRKRITEALAHT
jgi:putative ABC transport system permease protein